ncbi:cysteine protease [Lithospermum erythrorhizon]|uniref:Cysteine protease n=1 Tax=Lithospermum erythrorhizon TaxID=34254 RepID=A0AAV3RRK5_LITER
MATFEQDPDVVKWGLQKIYLNSQLLNQLKIYVKQSYTRHPLMDIIEVVNDHVEVENIGQSDSCSSPEGENFNRKWSCSLELADDYDIEIEVGKRLNQMISIPHIPKINGEIPSIDEATLDHQSLLHRLQLYELIEVKVQGDGNCQFRALSDQFYRTPAHHKFVRQQVINQLRSFRDNYEAYVPMACNDYLKKMSKNGEWGDHDFHQ